MAKKGKLALNELATPGRDYYTQRVTGCEGLQKLKRASTGSLTRCLAALTMYSVHVSLAAQSCVGKCTLIYLLNRRVHVRLCSVMSFT